MPKKVDNAYLANNGYEARVIRQLPKTQADRLKDSRMLASTLKSCLGASVEMELDDGTTINVTMAELLATKKIAYMLDNPEKIDLKELSSVLGEAKAEVGVSSIPSDAFKGLVDIEKKDDDTNT